MDLRSLLQDESLALPVVVDAREVRRAARAVRRRRRVQAGVALGVVAVVIGPGIPDRLLPPERRPPAAQASQQAGEERALFRVLDLSSALEAVPACAALPGASLRTSPPPATSEPVPGTRDVAVVGTPAQVAAVEACLRRVPRIGLQRLPWEPAG